MELHVMSLSDLMILSLWKEIQWVAKMGQVFSRAAPNH